MNDTDWIKEREKSIIHKHSIEITLDQRISHDLNNSSMILSILDNSIYYIAQKGRSYLLLREKRKKKQ